MLKKYFTPGENVELCSINKTLLPQEEVKHRGFTSKINQILMEDTIEIMMPIEQGQFVLLPRNAIYNMWVHSKNGLYECQVKIGDRYKNGNIYIQVLKVVTKVKRIQRREFYRYDCFLPMYCRHMSPDEQENKGIIRSVLLIWRLA